MPTPPADAPGQRSRPASADRLARQLGRKSVTWSVVTSAAAAAARATPDVDSVSARAPAEGYSVILSVPRTARARIPRS
jgi:hypothetical protein